MDLRAVDAGKGTGRVGGAKSAAAEARDSGLETWATGSVSRRNLWRGPREYAARPL